MNLEVGQRVIYSDLSPWETATVKEIYKGTNEARLQFDEDSEQLVVHQDGIREMTQENIIKFLPKSHPARAKLELLA